MTFKQLKDLLNNINDENILKYDLEIDVFHAGEGWESIELDVKLEDDVPIIDVADFEISRSEVLSVIPDDCTILDKDGEEID